jgi:CRISPR-associated endonuclease/helicase Cas3
MNPVKSVEEQYLATALNLVAPDRVFSWQRRLLDKFIAGPIPSVLDIPTGLGKTSVMAIWLVARLAGAVVPRRLVYVVDRRAVVDQATTEALHLKVFVEARPEIKAKLGLPNGLPISTLRGQQVDNREWQENPASPAIIVGTVDMIGSRLLFEGYGISRKMRPYHAGLLGADTLVVLDEAHLVPPFEKLLEAIAKAESDLQPKGMEERSIVPKMKLLSLSATGRSDQPAFELDEDDLKLGTITYKRLTADKRLTFNLLKNEEGLANALARNAWNLCSSGTVTTKIIVFSNKREVALKAKQALEKLAKGDKKAGIAEVKISTQLLVGGRRVHEREITAKWLKDHAFVAGSKNPLTQPAFVFATSAGEVGIDLDADHMVGDLVAWERMVQRFGRVNRRGEGDAKIIIIQEPSPKPTKGEENALKKSEKERETKDHKIIAAFHAKQETAQALSKPLGLLPNSDHGIDVSPAALCDLKRSTLPNADDAEDDKLRAARRAILSAAMTPAPLRPELTRPILDSWAMTSLPEHSGRPKIQPWLRGWVDDEPQITVAWRKHLPIDRSKDKTPLKLISDFFDAAPIHVSEELELETRQIIGWLKKRAEAIRKSHTLAKASDADLKPLHVDEPFAIILKRDGEPNRNPFISIADLLGESEDKKDMERRFYDATLVLDSRFAGLGADGLLDEKESALPQTLDDGNEWMGITKNGPVIRFRVRESDQTMPTKDKGWRQRLRVPVERSLEGDPLRWLIVDKWRSDSTTADDGAAGALQLLTAHQQAAVFKIQAIAQSLALPASYIQMLEIAARLHDEGKRAERWQKAFNAPRESGPFAKTPGPICQALLDSYRHEFSSLSALTADPDFCKLPENLRDLALHIVAAHHGFARPLISIRGCDEAPPSLLEMRAREVALRFVRMERRWGPWGLAWWESLLRAADQQASRELEEISETSTPTSSHG